MHTISYVRLHNGGLAANDTVSSQNLLLLSVDTHISSERVPDSMI